jgi:hypothetical protein
MKAEKNVVNRAPGIRSNPTRDASYGQSNAQPFDDDDSIVDRGNEIFLGGGADASKFSH